MKKNDNRGNALVLVIVVLALVIIFTGTIFMQINNQIKSNQNSLITVDTKYAAEAGIENTISQIIEQIEYKVNNYPPSSSKLMNRFTKSKNDDFAIVKNELIEAYDKLQGINDSYGVLNDVIIDLYNIISNNYSSVQQLQSDIYDLKYKLIWDVASEDDSVKNSIKDEVYSALSYISNSLVKIYSSDEIHKNHQPLYIETIKNTWNDDVYINQDDIDNKILGSNYDNTKNDSYQLNSIQNYMMELATANVTNLENSVNDYNLKNKIIILRNLLIYQNSFKNYLITVTNEINKIRYLSGPVQTVYDNINEIKSKICGLIDISIKNYANEIENYIYELWIEEFNEYNELNDQNYTMVKEILTKLETIKINLIELKCKLGYTPIDIDGEITLPDPPGTVNPPGNGDDIPGIYVEIQGYTYKFKDNDGDSVEAIFEDNYEYSVEAIERTPIVLSYSNNEVQSVDDISIEIISTGTNRGKKYKIKSKVIFKTQKTIGEDGKVKYQTNYSIKTHDKI